MESSESPPAPPREQVEAELRRAIDHCAKAVAGDRAGTAGVNAYSQAAEHLANAYRSLLGPR